VNACLTSLVLATLVCVGGAAPQPEPSLPARSPGQPLTARLEALTPSDPRAYFELGEEVADAADNQASLDLARRLFVLALHLDRARNGQRISAGACRALA